MTLHLQECLDLADCKIFPIPLGDQLVKGAEKFVGILKNLPLIQCLACAGDDLCEKVERVDVLEDVGLSVGDENHVQFVERLVNKADIILLYGCMLSSSVCQLRERRQEGLNSRPLHLSELPGHDCFTPAGAD